jgi:hypothetical protein
MIVRARLTFRGRLLARLLRSRFGWARRLGAAWLQIAIGSSPSEPGL